ncbi:FAD-dependent oxidoreductase [Caballeronia sordidicola]|uniref:Thioredoxin reductase n=1 Tax=Caballeronia sordidicola TaxID=196367 RepID=A0A226WVX5_CABSO|nr:FAD-dependent oxidoreductase [Caballeronia sordidicola]OXC75332.1 Thioredoxin reductase [Caballeronia sordidicola]
MSHVISSDSTLYAPLPSQLEFPYSSLEHRQHQIFPTLSTREIDSLRRFATPKSFKAGEMIFETGQVALGLFVLVRGRVQIYVPDALGKATVVTEHEDGHFMAEMAQLSGKPALINGRALTDVETLVMAPDKLRALIVADAELGERIMRALILRRLGLIEQGLGPIIVGNGSERRVVELQGFLRRNAYPATVIDACTDLEAMALVQSLGAGPADFPLVFCPDGSVLRAPDEAQLASCLGLVPAFEASHVYDIAIVGAGPAGLAAAVYAATEGLSVSVFDQRAPGGQAGASSRIENYLGFPTGISGQALAARAFQQALKFGVHLAIPGKVDAVLPADNAFTLSLADGQHITARTVVVASGAAYRKPLIQDFERYEGHGVYYWASQIEGKLVAGQDIVLVGGGNSAGQAIVFLANFARRVRVLIRGGSLESSMSRYLIDRIRALDNVEIGTECQLHALVGDETGLTEVLIRRGECKDDEHFATRHLFLFIGADPKTDWLGGSGVKLDERGFVVTGGASDLPGTTRQWGEGEFALRTSVPGVFAIGDVRSGSAKRVASAVGDGAAVVSQIHDYLSRRAVYEAARNSLPQP